MRHSLGSSSSLNPGCGKQVENTQYQNQEHRAEALHGVSGQRQQKNLQKCDQVRMSHMLGSEHLTDDLASFLGWDEPKGVLVPIFIHDKRPMGKYIASPGKAGTEWCSPTFVFLDGSVKNKMVLPY